MIVTVAKVTDLDRFLEVFATTGVAKRGWSIFDRDDDDDNAFLADLEIPSIAQSLRLLP